MAKFANHMGNLHGGPQTSPQHADPNEFLVWFSLTRPQVRVVGRLSGTDDSQRDSRESIRANHSQLKPLFFMARQADSPESLEFPIRANHPIRTHRANRFARFARITPLSWTPLFFRSGSEEGLSKLLMEFPAVLRVFLTTLLLLQMAVLHHGQ